MADDPVVVLPELMRAVHETILALRRDLAETKATQSRIYIVLRDIHSELEYLRTERRRVERIEIQIAEIRELDRENERIAKLVDKASEDAIKAAEAAAAALAELDPNKGRS